MDWKLPLQPASDEPLYRQISRIVREAIAAGRLKPGERIPSVTDLAKELSVNRATIVGAFRDLERARLVASHVGRGTFVAEAAASSPPDVRRPNAGTTGDLRELLAIGRPPGTIDLASGVPDPRTVPDGTLERLTGEVFAENPRRLYEYGGPAGLMELREAVAARLRVDADQVLVTNGSQQAVSLLACWAAQERREVLCETPTFTGIPRAFALMGHRVESVPWADATLDLSRVPRGRNLLYVCPDHHNPTGQSMTPAGRQDVRAFASQNDCIVVVDEIFRDLRFRGDPPPSLYAMLPAGRRVLVGSVSKTFMTGLRVGYLVADRPLVDDLRPVKRYLDLGGPALTQAIVAAFLRRGYSEHLKRVRAYYRERADAVAEALRREMPEGVRFSRPEGGFLMWVTLPAGASALQLYWRALERGVAVSPGPAHDMDGRYQNCFRISYGHATPAVLRQAIARLAALIKQKDLVPAGPGLEVGP
ncbi:MAG: PLP-dependent aminotransferase family protein [Planctomycetes bacterium]|nr:PLP-dependent aminotransferase family protein [Planctomycetota bacterium]